ncbi:MAG: hypothetical protein QG564_1339, partial [Campylobacterota bacterium]|nr:hypothetical protein [Campylobacterota bacterium]
ENSYKTINKNCPSCGSFLHFLPNKQNLGCSNCHAEVELEFPQSLEKRAFDFQNQGKVYSVESSVSCSSCGATSVFEAGIEAGSCAYCASPITKNKTDFNTTIHPDNILSFRLTQEQAQNKIKDWIHGLWFAPNKLKTTYKNKDKLKGCYLPYWNFDAKSYTSYVGERGTYYYVTKTRTVTVNGQTKTETYQERKIRWTTVSGSVRNTFVDVLVPAQKSLEPHLLDELGSWGLGRSKQFKEEALLGFQAMSASTTLQQGVVDAHNIMKEVIYSTIKRDIGGDEQRITSTDIDWSDEKFNQILLPIWIGAYLFSNKVFRICVNGDTGVVDGERPYSWIKIFFFSTFVLGVVGSALYWAHQNGLL